jgi:diaminohydroxyphosphoribosylaminopyrimidine deaminase/5-amino-6-(5-phosphoribosylamino)uracil reductase
VVVLASRHGRPDLVAALTDLKARGVHTLLLEGGGTLAWSFFEARAVDKVAFFIGPKLLGGGGASPLGGLGVEAMVDAIELSEVQTERVAGDILVSGRVQYREEA